MREETLKLGGTGYFQATIAELEIGCPLRIGASLDQPGGFDVLVPGGNQIGRIGPKSWVAEALAGGDIVHHASVNSVGRSGDAATVRVRVATGHPTETYEAPAALDREYKLGLVGESNYQSAIEKCGVGCDVILRHESDNPYGSEAIVAIVVGERIGYVPKGCWLQDAVHEEGKGCEATIASINGGPGKLGVVLDVRLTAGPMQQSSYTRWATPTAEVRPPVVTPAAPTATRPKQQKGWLARLFGG